KRQVTIPPAVQNAIRQWAKEIAGPLEHVMRAIGPALQRLNQRISPLGYVVNFEGLRLRLVRIEEKNADVFGVNGHAAKVIPGVFVTELPLEEETLGFVPSGLGWTAIRIEDAPDHRGPTEQGFEQIAKLMTLKAEERGAQAEIRDLLFTHPI